jgi:hypothetical protein
MLDGPQRRINTKKRALQLGYAGKIEDDVCYQYANNSQSVCQRGYENGFKSNQKWAQTEPYKQGFALSEAAAHSDGTSDSVDSCREFVLARI